MNKKVTFGHVEFSKSDIVGAIITNSYPEIHSDSLIWSSMKKLIYDNEFRNEVTEIGKQLIKDGRLSIKIKREDTSNSPAMISFSCVTEMDPEDFNESCGIDIKEFISDEEMSLINNRKYPWGNKR